MTHEIEYNDALDVYMCVVCGASFTRETLAEEAAAISNATCPGPAAEEGTSFTVTPPGNPYTIDPTSNAPFFYSFMWADDLPTGEIAGEYSVVPRPWPDDLPPDLYAVDLYDKALKKGTRLINSWLNDDEDKS